MSRSIKHTPIYKYKYDSKAKHMANKSVRRYYKKAERFIPGSEYKKVYDSWMVNEYISYYPKVDEAWWYQYHLRK